MQNTVLNCPACHASVNMTSTSEPTLKCAFCGTVMKNPFYKENDTSTPMAMPIININVAQPAYQTAPPPPPPQMAYGQPQVLPVKSSKSWLTTLILLLTLGLFGGHRFYTGHKVIGVIQLFTLGFAGLWTFVDLILLITDNYHDSKGLPLRGKHLSKRTSLILVGGVPLACIALIAIANNASKVDLPAEQGWITGIERCVDSDAYGELVLPDHINIWQDWHEDHGSIVGTVAHDTKVKIIEARRSSSGEDITYYKIETPDGVRGWVSEAFVQFQPLDSGVVPRTDC